MPFFSAILLLHQHSRKWISYCSWKPSLLLTAIVAVLYYIKIISSWDWRWSPKESMRKASWWAGAVGVFSWSLQCSLLQGGRWGDRLSTLPSTAWFVQIFAGLRIQNDLKTTSHRVKKDVTSATTQIQHRQPQWKQRNRSSASNSGRVYSTWTG